MFLIVDNTGEAATISGQVEIFFHFWLNNKFVQRIFKTNKGVLVCLEKLLSNLKMKLKDITCLGVVVGAGRFTPVRLAVTAVNALAYSLKIPAVALPKNFDQAAALKLAKSAVAAANAAAKAGQAGRAGKYVVPTYSGEARVGPPAGRQD